MALHNVIRDSCQEDTDFVHWEAVEEYEHHDDEVEDNVPNTDHVLYVPAGDRVMKDVRDSITEKIVRRYQLLY